ncbi:MAG TPA: GNAT family protein [Candidatus Binatia bacterium]|nr:GNAT family protein [Candidatus Binatia bacterium]
MFEHSGIGIRPFRAEDVPALFAAARESIPELCRWMVWCHEDYSLGDSRAFVLACDMDWAAGRRYSFAIYDGKAGTFLGSIGLSALDRTHHLANLGYWVRSGRTRRGVARAAVGLAARFAFQELGLNRLEMIIPVENQNSLRVAQRVGAHREGILRQRLMLGGRPRDAVSYSLVARDCREQSQPAAEIVSVPMAAGVSVGAERMVGEVG